MAESLHSLALLEFDRNKYAAAEARFREALALRRARGAVPGELAATLEQLGATLSETGKHAEAEPFLREALALRRQSGPDTPETMATIDSLALALHRKGDFKQAEALFRDAVEQGRRLPASVTPAKVSSALNLALLVHRYDRDARAAEPMYREALDLARRLYPNDHPDLANCMSEFARGLRDLGKLSEAEALSREALAMWRRLYGDRHRETMISTQSLAGLLATPKPGDRPGAGDVGPAETGRRESLYREALATGRALFGETHPLVLGAHNAFASFLDARNRFNEAVRLRESELAGAIIQYGEHHAVTARALMGLGRNALARGQVAEAEPHLRRALAARQKLHPAGHWRIAEASAALGQCLLRARRFDEAEPLLSQGYEGLRASKDATPQETRAALNNLVALYDSWGRPAEAARYRAQKSDPDRARAVAYSSQLPASSSQLRSSQLPAPRFPLPASRFRLPAPRFPLPASRFRRFPPFPLPLSRFLLALPASRLRTPGRYSRATRQRIDARGTDGWQITRRPGQCDERRGNNRQRGRIGRLNGVHQGTRSGCEQNAADAGHETDQDRAQARRRRPMPSGGAAWRRAPRGSPSRALSGQRPRPHPVDSHQRNEQTRGREEQA